MVEGESTQVSLKARGNPPEMEYSWATAAVDPAHIATAGHTLTIESAKRSHAGNYSVTATNSYGDFSTTISFHIEVLYPPT